MIFLSALHLEKSSKMDPNLKKNQKPTWVIKPKPITTTKRGLVPEFDKYLDPAMEKAKMKALHRTPVSRMSTMGRARGSLNLTSEKKLKGSFSVLPAMIKTFLPGFALGSLMKIVCDG